MIGRDYFVRQAMTLLKMARLTKDPQAAAGLTEKAADLQALSDEAPLAQVLSPIAPDIQNRLS